MIQSLLMLVVYLLIIGLVFWLVHWALSQLPIPEPIATVIRVLLIVVMVVIVILLLLNLVGGLPALRVGWLEPALTASVGVVRIRGKIDDYLDGQDRPAARMD